MNKNKLISMATAGAMVFSAAVPATAMITAATAITTMAAGTTGWVNNNTSYYKDGTLCTNGTFLINGKYYYFNNVGIKQTNVLKTNITIGTKKGTMYFGSDGAAVNGRQEVNTSTYWFDNEYFAYVGIWQLNGNYYYFSSNGIMAKSQLITYNGNKYYAGSNGALLTNTKKSNITDGKAQYTFYFNERGEAVTGKQKIGNNYYVFDNNKHLVINSITTVKENGVNNKYCAGADGILVMNAWKDNLTENGGTWNFYFDGTGKAVIGKQKLSKNGKTDYYYFDNNGHQVLNQFYKNTYYIEKSGILAINASKDVNGKTYHFDGTGELYKGLHKFNGKYYYSNSDGSLVKNKWEENYTYYCSANGECCTGWKKIDSKWYYFNASAKKLIGLQAIDNKTYVLQADGSAYTGKGKTKFKNGNYYYLKKDSNGRSYICKDGIYGKYYCNSNGIVQAGKQAVGKYTYYFSKDAADYGKMLKDKVVKISKKYYYFNKNGRMVTNTTVSNLKVNGIKYSKAYFNNSGVFVSGKSTK